MKYHYQIINKNDSTDIKEDSRNIRIIKDGFDSYQKAKEIGEIQRAYLSYNSEVYDVKVIDNE